MTDKMREEFEAWHFGEVDRLARTVGVDSAARFNESMEERWPCWQASRAAIEMELPKTYPDESVSSVYSKFAQAIKAQGLRVKP